MHPAVASLRWDACTEPFPSAALPAALDGLVYCPGTIRLRPFERLTDAEWQEDLDLNLLGAVRAIRGVLKALRQSVDRLAAIPVRGHMIEPAGKLNAVRSWPAQALSLVMLDCKT